MKRWYLKTLLVFLLLVSLAEAAPRRVVYGADGSVAIIYPAPKSRRKGETEAAFLKRVFERATKGTELEGLPYDDIDSSALPSTRKDRNKWRGKKGQGVKVDHSVVTEAEKRKKIEDDLAYLLTLPVLASGFADPDPEHGSRAVKILKLQRKLQKREY